VKHLPIAQIKSVLPSTLAQIRHQGDPDEQSNDSDPFVECSAAFGFID
jgi:hypothetical protein